MTFTTKHKKEIVQIICDSLRNKFKNYKPETKYMPFHHNLLGKDRMALYSFIQGLHTTFGTSIFEPVAETLAKLNHKNAIKQYTLGSEMAKEAQHKITDIMNKLSVADGVVSKGKEIEEIRKLATKGAFIKTKTSKVDLFVERHDGSVYMFDLKTAKPNTEGFKGHKQKLLEWCAIFLAKDPEASINTVIAMPYNPYYPKPYQRWTIRGMLDLDKELMVGEDFWNFLGGDGAYEELLTCFGSAGMSMKKEIDDYFETFNLNQISTGLS